MTTRLFDLSATLAVLTIDGPDAATFVQGQATCDTRQLQPGAAMAGALCNLQGRMLVSFYAVAGADGLLLVLPRDRLLPVLQHLKKYAVFAKVVLRDAALAITGGLGMPAAHPDALLLRPAADGTPRFLLLTATGAADNATDNAAWHAAAISAGDLLVDNALAERFLPQALNYDLTGAVSFKKGCYTGQEVVARMHFKGRMKERLYQATADTGAVPAANTPVLDAAGKTVGDVVAAVQHAGRTQLAAVLRHDAVAGALHLGDAGGPLLRVLPPALSFPELAS